MRTIYKCLDIVCLACLSVIAIGTAIILLLACIYG